MSVLVQITYLLIYIKLYNPDNNEKGNKYVPDSKKNDEIPYLEDNYHEVKTTEQLDQEISAFLTNAKQKELFNSDA